MSVGFGSCYPWMMGVRIPVAIAFAAVLFGCATPGVVETAYHGDLATLKREIRAAQEAGELDHTRVQALAEAVARRELRSAKGSDAVARIQASRGCVGRVRRELEERAKRQDDPGAAATFLLSELGLVERTGLSLRYATASSAAWRSVGARATAERRHGALRRQLMQDPDERVRRAALSAALELGDATDLEDLLEAARVDPDPMSRSLAARAVGAIGTERAVLALRDAWARAEEDARLTIIEAWAHPKSMADGGEVQLLWVTETQRGLPALAAGRAVAQAGGPNADSGRAVLVRAVGEGTTDERRLAIQLVPLGHEDAEEALVVASKDEDRGVRVLALARLLDAAKHRSEAAKALRQTAKAKGNFGRQARAALASIGDSSVVPYFRRDLAAPNPGARRLAAVGLIRLGDYSGAAPALADDDGSVRMSVACSILAP